MPYIIDYLLVLCVFAASLSGDFGFGRVDGFKAFRHVLLRNAIATVSLVSHDWKNTFPHQAERTRNRIIVFCVFNVALALLVAACVRVCNYT